MGQRLAPPSFYLFLCIATAVFVGSLFDIPKNALIFVFIILPMGSGIFLLFSGRSWLSVACLTLFSIGVISIQSLLFPSFGNDHVQFHTTEKKARIKGEIVTFAKKGEIKTSYVLRCKSIQLPGEKEKSVYGLINLSVYGQKNLPGYGDDVEFFSRIRPIRNFANPGGFDYVRHMKLKKIYGSAYARSDQLTAVKNNHGLSAIVALFRHIEWLRNKIDTQIWSLQFDGIQSKKILSSIITGKREHLDSEIRDLFSKTGISHLLAISGLHLSIISLLFYHLFYFFFCLSKQMAITGNARKAALICAIVPVFIYAVFSGFSPSTQRAFIMAAVFLCSFVFEREKDLFSSLCVAGIIILLVDPAALFSVSFQLSFTCVAFILAGFDLSAPWIGKLKNKLVTRAVSMVLVTVFAGIGTLPLTAHYFHLVSHVQVITNLIAVPLLGFIVLPVGFAAAILSFFVPFISDQMFLFCCWTIEFIAMLAQYFSQFDWSWCRVMSISWMEVSIFYLFFVLVLVLVKINVSKRRVLGAAVLMVACSAMGYKAIEMRMTQSTESVEITVLDVGQGNCTLITTPSNQAILIDGGGFSGRSSFDTGRLIIAPFLWKKGVHSIEYVILTHPESDHLKGLIYLFDNFSINGFIKNSDKSQSIGYDKLMRICQKKDIQIFIPTKEHRRLVAGSVELVFFMSEPQIRGQNLNDNSLVTQLRYKKFSMLFPGDVLAKRENQLVRQFGSQLKSDLMLSPHHGSQSSSTKFFLEKILPESVIISCGWHNRYGFPDKIVLKRYKDQGINVFRTDIHGAVQITSTGQQFRLETFKGR